MTSDARTAIIGAGFSGTLLAIHFLRHAEAGDRIMLFEKSPPFGRGIAYGAESDSHLLNVRAGSMGAFEEDPAGFLAWLNSRESGDIRPLCRPVSPDIFAPRRLYGRYLQHCLQRTLSEPGNEYLFRPVAGEVTDLAQGPDGLTVKLADGRTFEADRAVLALGNLPPDRNEPPFYVGDPWDEAALADLDPADDVLIVGTGLTMIDKVLSLQDRGHAGRIHAVSRHGLLPQVHAPDGGHRHPWRLSIPLPASSVGLLRVVRAEAEHALAKGRAWQEVIQAMRPHVQLAWQRLPMEQRRRFLRHLRPWWDIHRHRISPEAAARIERLMRSGQLVVQAGRVESRRPAGDRVEVRIRRRGGGQAEMLRVARVINCTGPRQDHSGGESLLLRNLLFRGAVRADPLDLGLDVDWNCAVLDRYGRSSDRVFAVGPLTRGAFWEITAVPEIRRQCAELVARIAEHHARQQDWRGFHGPAGARWFGRAGGLRRVI